jgi:hypothetical protein
VGFEDKKCAGLFEPCHQPVEHEMSDPARKGPPVYLCQEHWEWSEKLVAALQADPEFTKEFAKAVEEAELKVH